ncbi:MAG: archaemetzincin [Planctomycetota bacterium]|jgi:archaemetzincin
MRRFVAVLCLAALGSAVEKPKPAATPAQLAFATRDAKDFEKMGKPGPHDWLARFKERGQTYRRYVESHPVRAQAGERLAFLPVGPFGPIQRGVFDNCVAFARVWFDLDVLVLEGKPLPKSGWHRQRSWGRQYETRYFLDHLLPNHMPKNTVCFLAVTIADLYPDPSWNFVFGEASLRRRVGVWSLARYFPQFRGLEPTPERMRQALRRACKVVVHEAGHAFGLEHCIYFQCNMNGSNSLEETDRQPLRLCPVCLKKLQWNRGFDVLRRYERLLAFFSKHGLAPEAKWTAARLARIRAVK